MKNICFFNCTKFWGGGEKLHLEYAVKFREKGYNVIITAKNNSPLFQKAKDAQFQVHSINIGNLSFLNPFKKKKIRSFYKSYNIDTVFFIIPSDLKAGGIAAKKAGVEKIVYLRGIAVPIKRNFLNIYLLKKVVTHIIANSKETKRTILKNLANDIEPEKIKVIYHGIDIREHSEKSTNKIFKKEKNEIIIGNLGRLTEQKGHKYLIDLATILKNTTQNFKIIIAGEGESKDELVKLAEKSGLKESVTFLGFISDIKSFLNEIDIFVLPSIWEGFGFAIVEAMIAEKPVIAFNITSNPEIIIDTETGFLVEFPNVEQFAEKVKLLIHNKELRETLGEKGKLRVIEQFDIDKKIDELENYLIT